jgi:hypothetical protein
VHDRRDAALRWCSGPARTILRDDQAAPALVGGIRVVVVAVFALAAVATEAVAVTINACSLRAGVVIVAGSD